MKDILDVYEALGGNKRVAEITSIRPTHVAVWKNRGVIPSVHWHKLVAASEGKLTFEVLENLKPTENSYVSSPS